MIKEKYSNYILETIKKAKENKEWAISDYVTPLKNFYENLNKDAKKQFNSSMIELLQDEIYIDNLVDICRELSIRESCAVLIGLFTNKQKSFKENGYPVWIEGLDRNIIYSLGILKCKKSIIILRQLLEDKINKKDTLSLNLSWDSYGVTIHALTNISPKESSKYFGWWIDIIRKVENERVSFAKNLGDWKKIDKKIPDFEVGRVVFGFPSVKNCIISVAQAGGLVGLKKWLNSVILYSKKDKEFLREQIQILADGTNDLLPNLKELCNYSGKSEVLATELSFLPGYKVEEV